MIIDIVTGAGTGRTELAAFDAALFNAGVANYNLLCLSSVIPPGTNLKIHKSKLTDMPGEWGDRLYVVMAEMRVSDPGVEAWAGIGWVQEKKSGKGLFVEHHGLSEKTVRWDIEHSLKSLNETRGVDFGAIQMVVRGGICTNKPFCALVTAVYETAEWETNKLVKS
jgi:arginine decarboxylase